MDICSIEGCETVCSPARDRPTGMERMIKGMCAMHYARQRRGMDMAAPKRHTHGDYCSLPGCEEKWYSADYCVLHYQRNRYGTDMYAPKKRANGVAHERDDMGRKYCPKCDQWLSMENFHASKDAAGYNDGFYFCCRTCRYKRHKEQGYTSPGYLHGIGHDRYRELLANGCRGCGIMDDLVVDHDHDCCPGPYGCSRCVRGCLCSPCNKALGMLRDDPVRIRALLSYLEAWRLTSAGQFEEKNGRQE